MRAEENTFVREGAPQSLRPCQRMSRTPSEKLAKFAAESRYPHPCSCTTGNNQSSVHTRRSSSFPSDVGVSFPKHTTRAQKLTFDGEIKRARHHPLPVGVEIQRHDLRGVAQERVHALARLDVEHPAGKAKRFSAVDRSNTRCQHIGRIRRTRWGLREKSRSSLQRRRNSGRDNGHDLWQARTHTSRLLPCMKCFY